MKKGRVRVERNAYDLLGRLIRTEQDVAATTLEPAKTLVWDYLYNAQGLLDTIVYPELKPEAATTCLSAVYQSPNARLNSGCFLATRYEYDEFGYLLQTTEPGERITQYQELDALGRAGRVVLPDTRALTYRYNFRGQATQVTLPDGISTTLTGYNSRGQQEETIGATGARETWRYTPEGRLAATQNHGNSLQGIPGLNPTEYAYTAAGLLEKVVNAELETIEYTYNANGFADGTYDANQTFFDVDSDSLGRTMGQWDAYGEHTQTDYRQGGREVVTTNALGEKTIYHYNAFGELASATDAEGNQINFAYNERGELIAQWDQLNNVEYFARNTRSQVTAILDKQNRTTTLAYDAAGNMSHITQPEVGTTHYGYDKGNRLTSVTSAKGFAANDPLYTQHYTFEVNGQLDTVTNELGYVTDYNIDPSGRLTSIDLPSYDQIQYQYNALGQMTQRIANGDSATQENWQYDQVGRLTSISNQSYAESYNYTPTGKLGSTNNSTLNQTVAYNYDLNNRRTGLTTALQSTVYERDELGRIAKLTEGNDVYTFGYDANNRLISKTVNNGTRDVRLYDERGNVLAIALQRQQTDKERRWYGEQYGFDGRFFRDYHRTRNLAPSTDITAFEAQLDRAADALAEQFTENGYLTTDLLVYQYDASGNVIGKQYNDTFSFFYEYDNADRLISAYEPEYLVYRFKWDANGNRTKKQVRNLVFNYTYNEANQLVSESYDRARPRYGIGFTFGWDMDDHDEDNYFYLEHLWDRYKQHSIERTTKWYHYDANGNLDRIEQGWHDVQTLEHDVYGRLTHIETRFGAAIDYVYDSRDRRIGSSQANWRTERATFSLYDGRQELEQYTQSTNTGHNTHPWFHGWLNRGHWGRHSQQETTSELAAYRKLVTLPNQVAGLYGQMLSQELFLPERQEFKFGYSGNGFAWGHANGNRHKHFASKLYFSQDALNSTIKVTGENPEYSWRYGYTPFGQAYGFDKRRNPDWRNRFYGNNYLNSHVVPYLYTGKYTDPLTGLVNMDARWYDPRTARFTQGDQYNHANLMLPKGAQSELLRYIGRTQSDLLKDPAQQMRYGYVSGNPLRWVDPLGLCYPEAHGVEPITSNGGIETYQYRDGSYYDVWSPSVPQANYEPLSEAEHVALDALGTADPSPVTDLAHAGIYLKEGRFADAGLTAVGTVPLIGDSAKLLKYGDDAASLVANKPSLYRGVSAEHPELAAAKNGDVVPGNVNGTVTPEMHNIGGHAADSPYTSWTRDPEIAVQHAEKHGDGGVVLRVPQEAPPKDSTWNWEWSPDIYGEQEVLMRGTRSDVEVFKQ